MLYWSSVKMSPVLLEKHDIKIGRHYFLTKLYINYPDEMVANNSSMYMGFFSFHAHTILWT